MARVLVSHERSGVVRRAFREAGHEAWSCDLEPAEDGSQFHLQCDVRQVLDGLRVPPEHPAIPYGREGWRLLRWDALIAFPDCTYLCASGLHWNKRRPGRAQLTEGALEHVRMLLGADIPRIALENPRGCIGTRIRPSDQTLQPNQFGHDASKETMLWLKNLPPLVIDIAQCIPPRMVDGRPRWGNQTDSGQNRLGPSPTRAADRARTYEGIARAMAAQWGPILLTPAPAGESDGSRWRD